MRRVMPSLVLCLVSSARTTKAVRSGCPLGPKTPGLISTWVTVCWKPNTAVVPKVTDTGSWKWTLRLWIDKALIVKNKRLSPERSRLISKWDTVYWHVGHFYVHWENQTPLCVPKEAEVTDKARRKCLVWNVRKAKYKIQSKKLGSNFIEKTKHLLGVS